MTRVVCFIQGLALLVLGFLGIMNLVPALGNRVLFLNIFEIILGVIGILFGMYSGRDNEKIRQKSENTRLRKENEKFVKDGSDQMVNENEEMKKEIGQMKKEKEDQLRQEATQKKDQDK